MQERRHGRYGHGRNGYGRTRHGRSGYGRNGHGRWYGRKRWKRRSVELAVAGRSGKCLGWTNL
jgi:hypothetical protein